MKVRVNQRAEMSLDITVPENAGKNLTEQINWAKKMAENIQVSINDFFIEQGQVETARVQVIQFSQQATPL